MASTVSSKLLAHWWVLCKSLVQLVASSSKPLEEIRLEAKSDMDSILTGYLYDSPLIRL